MSVFKVIPEYQEYGINTLGVVINFRTKKELKWRKDVGGYARVGLYSKGVCKNKLVHRLVCETFLTKENGLLHVNHKNGVRWDNRLVNLEWTSPIRNVVHGVQRAKKTKKVGVYLLLPNNKWRAQIKIGGKKVHLGLFQRKNDAYQAYYTKHIELHGFAPWKVG